MNRLPEVTPEVFDAVQTEIKRVGDEKGWYNEFAKDVEKDNPIIMGTALLFSQHILDQYGDVIGHDLINKAVLFTYKLLQTQMEVDKLNTMYRIKETK